MSYTPGEEWRAFALCLHVEDKSIWFPAPYEKSKYHKAIAICRQCPVKDDCLGYALQHRELSGIWGGVGDRKRGRMVGKSR